MPMTPYHYDRIRGTKVTRCPRHVIAISYDDDYEDGKTDDDKIYQTTTLTNWSICERKYTQSGTWNTQSLCGNSKLTLWQTLYSLISGRRGVWILVPSVSEWLAVSNGYAELTAGRLWIPGITLPCQADMIPEANNKNQRSGYIVLGGSTEILHCRIYKTECHIVGVSNYGNVELDNLISADPVIGRHGGTDDDTNIPSDNRLADISEKMSRWYCGMIDEWRGSDCGTWGHTASQLSHSYWRRKYANGNVVKHQNTEAHKLERAALFGGRSDVYRYGNVSEPLYRLDVRSMYPYVLSSRPCPVALSVYGNGQSAEYLLDVMKTHCVCARVELDTDVDNYPVKTSTKKLLTAMHADRSIGKYQFSRDDITLYPTGKFITVLVGEELKNAILLGHVVKVYDFAIYRYANEFMPLMYSLIMKRREAEYNGDKIRGAFYKLLANSFAGKFARKPGGWTTDKRYSIAEAWGEEVMPHHETGLPTRVRSIGFVPQYWQAADDTPSGCPVILAWLTSEGRRILRKIVEWCGIDNVIQTDTDGLCVNDVGFNKITKMKGLFGNRAGQLRLVETYSTAQYYTPRHYCVDGDWIMAGFSENHRVTDDGIIIDQSKQSLYPADTADGPSGVRVTQRSCMISLIADTHRVKLDDGTTRAYRARQSSNYYDDDTPEREYRQLTIFD